MAHPLGFALASPLTKTFSTLNKNNLAVQSSAWIGCTVAPAPCLPLQLKASIHDPGEGSTRDTSRIKTGGAGDPLCARRSPSLLLEEIVEHRRLLVALGAGLLQHSLQPVRFQLYRHRHSSRRDSGLSSKFRNRRDRSSPLPASRTRCGAGSPRTTAGR